MQYSAIERCQSSRTERNYFDMEFNMAELSSLEGQGKEKLFFFFL